MTMRSATLSAHDAAILAAWPLGAIRRVMMPQTGVVHRTLLVESATGCYALRAYRHAHRAPVEREHALIAYAAARGIPAVCPVPLPAADLDLAAAWYGQLRLHDLWLYNGYYLEGNQRLARFIRPDPFVPFTTRWKALVPLLA